MNYRFTGFLDEIYATLIVRLHHTEPFQQGQLWRYAADFKTNSGKQLGVKLTRRAPGVGELEVYFDPAVAMEEKIMPDILLGVRRVSAVQGSVLFRKGAFNRRGATDAEKVAYAFPVLLVIRNAEGEVRWMEVRGAGVDDRKIDDRKILASSSCQDFPISNG